MKEVRHRRTELEPARDEQRNDNERKILRSTCKQDDWDQKWLWIGCLIFRLMNAMLVRTYFNPDEHWQVLEVAHRIVFGYGHLTWEWSTGLRSYVHPLIFAALYKCLAELGLDTPWFMARAPRLLQSLFAAVGDVYLFKLTNHVFGRRAAFWALFCQMTNWFTFFCMVRTLSNSLEAVLTIVALFYWQAHPLSLSRQSYGSISNRQLALVAAALACMIRPTNAIIWVYMGTLHLWVTHDKYKFLLAELFPIGSCCLGLLSLLDRWMYGQWTFVLWNFFQFNFLSSGGDYYGTHPWHWYFSQGFPVMVFTFLPLSIAGVWWGKSWRFAGLIGWVLGLYSVLGHKEFRFVLSMLPVSMMFAGYGLTVLEEQNLSLNLPKSTAKAESSQDSTHPDTRQIPDEYTSINSEHEKWSLKFSWTILILLLTNCPVAFYTSLVHQRGTEAVMEYLATEANHGHIRSVLFLMPCHATPFYSSFHKNLPMRFLDCSPSDAPGYVDEADRFMANPSGFLLASFPQTVSNASVPSHLVLFDSLEPHVRGFLDEHSYKLDQKFFHTHIPVDRELQANVLVFTSMVI